MSAFQRGERSQLQIAGTRPSLQNGQLRVSTGNTSIDAVCSGGLPIGALWLIEEDRFGHYTRALHRYFLGEGAVHKHAMLVANLDEEPGEFITKIPQLCQEQQSPSSRQAPAPAPIAGAAVGRHGMNSNAADDLRIAWRYNDLPKVSAEVSATYSFDLSTQIAAADLAALDISTFGPQQQQSAHNDGLGGFKNALYARLLDAIRAKIAAQPPENLLRISLSGVGGPLWYSSEMSADLCRFLTLLRAMLHQAPAVCCVSMPMHLLQWHDDRLVQRVRNCVDIALHLESFAGSERSTNPIFAEYHGLLHITRLRALNTLAAGTPATHDLAFKLRRRQFVVEKLHLPPELQDESAEAPPPTGCGGAGGGQSVLDF